MKLKLLIGIMLLGGCVYADTSAVPTADEARTTMPSFDEPGFKRVVDAIKSAALKGETSVKVDLSDVDFKTANKYAFLLQNKGYLVNLASGKTGANSALKISWDLGLKDKGL
jgi:hypothetical protein